MGLGDFHKKRCLGGVLALAGILLYTALVPGHVISQATALALKIEFGPVIEMACHNGLAGTRDPAEPGKPTIPEKQCPFCTGYAAFMTALAGAIDTGELDADRVQLAFATLHEDIAERHFGRPHNRGPPLNPLTS